MTPACKHPPTRQFSWIVNSYDANSKPVLLLCMGCCDCGYTRTFDITKKFKPVKREENK